MLDVPQNKGSLMEDFLASSGSGGPSGRSARFAIGDLSEDVRHELERLARSNTLAHRVVTRSRIVLLLARGEDVGRVAATLGIGAATVRRWSRRFAAKGIAGIVRDAEGRGRRSQQADTLTAALRSHLEAQRSGAPVPSMRALARDLRVSVTTVHRWLTRLSADDGAGK